MNDANVKMICFDMDGTIADLYSVEGWLSKVRAEDVLPYTIAKPMWDMGRLVETLINLQKIGIEVRIITWLSMGSSEKYKRATRDAKREWLERFNFPFDHFHGVQYGATKADSVRKYLTKDETAILIDDNLKVRKGWGLGEAINPTEIDIIEYLESFLNEGF